MLLQGGSSWHDNRVDGVLVHQWPTPSISTACPNAGALHALGAESRRQLLELVARLVERLDHALPFVLTPRPLLSALPLVRSEFAG